MIVQHASAFFNGVCRECFPEIVDPLPPGERGRVVTSVDVAGHLFTLCAAHTNQLIKELTRAGVRRDI